MNRILEIILRAKDEVSAVLNRTQTSVSKFGSVTAAVFKGLTAALAGLALGKFFKDSIQEGAEAERGMARLGVAVTNAGVDFRKFRPALEEAIDGVRRLSTFTDDDLRNALTNMVTLTGDVAGSTKNLGLVADLAAARQIDLSTASDLVSKAMNGNVTGLNKLGFAGKDTVTVLENLRGSVGGFAATDAKTFDGAIKNLSNSWKEFQESVGLAILGGGEMSGLAGKLSGALAKLAVFVEENADVFGVWIDAVLSMGGAIWDLVRFPLKVLVTALGTVVDSIGLVLEAIGKLVSTGGNLLKKLGIDFGTNVGESIQKVGQSLQRISGATFDAMWGEAKKAEEKTTNTVKIEGAKRVRLTKEEAADRAKAQKEYQKEHDRVVEEIVIKSLQLQQGLTEEEAKEYVRRQRFLGNHLGVTISSLENGYERVDRLNEKLKLQWTKHLGGIAFQWSLLTSSVVPQVRQIADEAGTAGDALGGLATKTTDWVRVVEQGARGAVGLAQGMQLIGDKAAAALQNTIALGTSLADVFKERGEGDPFNFTALFGAAGALAGILGSLFSGSGKLEQERRRLLEKNTDAIAKLTSGVGELARLQTPGRQIADIGAALTEAMSKGGPGKFASEVVTNNLRAALLSRGLGLGDLEDFAKDLGLELPKIGGQFDIRGLRQILEAIGKIDAGFAATYSEQVKRIQAGLGFGAIDVADEFGQVLSAVALGGENAITRALAGADFGTMEGRTAAAQSLRDLFNNLSKLGLSDFGGLSQTDFVDAIGRLVDILADPERVINQGSLIGAVTPDQPALDLSAIAESSVQQLDVLGSIDSGIGGLTAAITRWTDIDTGRPRQVTVTIGDVFVQGGPTTSETGLAVQEAVRTAINEALADAYRDDRLATGDVARTM